MPDLYLIDGSALAYRSYYGFIRNPLINSKGENTGAIFGFVNSLLRLIKSRSVEYLGVVFDTPHPTFRHEMYEGYKATRKETPDDLRSQLPKIQEVVKAMNIPLITLKGHEADDLMATIAVRASQEGIKTFLVTRDKDLMQLVNPKVSLFDIGDLKEIGRDEVIASHGVPPEKIPDLLALMGDSSDNIPGIPGVGPKAAKELLGLYDDFDNVLENAENVPKAGMRKKVMAGIDSARLSRKLVELDKEAPIEFDADSFRVKPPESEGLRAMFKELEFTSLIKEVEAPRKAHEMKAILLDTPAKADALVAGIREKGSFAFDTETTGTSPMQDEIVGLSISVETGEGYYLPLKHAEGVLDATTAILDKLKPVFADPEIRRIAHNALFDWEVLERAGIPVASVDVDTMIAGYLINPTGRQTGLNTLGEAYLNRGKQSITELIGTGKKRITFDQVPLAEATNYAAADAELTLSLDPVLQRELEKHEQISLFRDLEMPLVPVLKAMEMRGVTLDTNFLGELSGQWEEELESLTSEIHSLAGEEFNINSTQQLGKILFEKLGLKKGKKTKTGYSTNVEVLEELAPVHPLPQKMLAYRQFQKLKSTYVDALPELVHPQTGRIHTSFNQTVTATGRLSSSNPNLQNIPIRTGDGKEIRKALVAGNDSMVLLSADYSQIELRLLAAFSGDSAMQEAFRSGEDIHRSTAALVMGVFPEMVTDDQRRQAKTANFGVIYGMSAFGLSRQLGIPHKEAQAFIDAYFAHYPDIRGYMDGIVEEARKDGYVTTLSGRRRYLPELVSPNGQVRSFAERTAINTPIQGSAADLIKKAMVGIYARLVQSEMRAWMLLQVHDELVFEVHKGDAEALSSLVKEEMEGAYDLPVPMLAEVGTGENWLEAH